MGAVSGLLVGRSGTVLEARSTLTICEPSACGANSTIRKFRIVRIEGIVANRNGRLIPTARREHVQAIHSTAAMSHPYEIHLQAPSGQRRTLHLQAQSQTHAQLSAIELAGPRATVIRCHRLGDW